MFYVYNGISIPSLSTCEVSVTKAFDDISEKGSLFEYSLEQGEEWGRLTVLGLISGSLEEGRVGGGLQNF